MRTDKNHKKDAIFSVKVSEVSYVVTMSNFSISTAICIMSLPLAEGGTVQCTSLLQKEAFTAGIGTGTGWAISRGKRIKTK